MTGPIVRTKQGKLEGLISEDFLGGKFYSFLGIPYAKPPLGKLRFKSPQPSEPWKGVRKATEERDGCYSIDLFMRCPFGQEDCLYLNVYTPNLPSTGAITPKPVMVFLHGGGFICGSGTPHLYGPEFLITQDIVLITINYRLGALGFLSLEDVNLKVPGNAALRDQVMALRWVQENVKNFGGDPNNVTIFGESAGAAAAQYLVLSPMAKGLFHKAIMQSGSVLNPWAMTKPMGKDICKYLGITTKNGEEMLKRLQELPVDDILAAQLSLIDSLRPDVARPFGPIIEKPSPYEESFLTEDPVVLMEKGRYNHVPMIIGYNSREGVMFEITLKDSGQRDDLETAVPHLLMLEKGSHLSLEVKRMIEEFYFHGKPISGDPLYQLQTDNVFLRGIYKSTKYFGETCSKPVYYYRFSHDGPMTTAKSLAGIEDPGACHGDELSYLFKNITVAGPIEKDSAQCRSILRIVGLWANFAKSGDPNCRNNHLWKPISKNELNFIDIGEDIVPGVNPDSERMDFWEEVFKIKSVTSKL